MQVILNVSWLLLGNVKVHVELSLFSLTTSSTSDFFSMFTFLFNVFIVCAMFMQVCMYIQQQYMLSPVNSCVKNRSLVWPF